VEDLGIDRENIIIDLRETRCECVLLASGSG